MNLKEPTFAQGMIAGHGVGMEIARREIRRAIAPHLKHLRGLEFPLCRCIEAIDAAARAPRKARSKR